MNLKRQTELDLINEELGATSVFSLSLFMNSKFEPICDGKMISMYHKRIRVKTICCL